MLKGGKERKGKNRWKRGEGPRRRMGEREGKGRKKKRKGGMDVKGRKRRKGKRSKETRRRICEGEREGREEGKEVLVNGRNGC